VAYLTKIRIKSRVCLVLVTWYGQVLSENPTSNSKHPSLLPKFVHLDILKMSDQAFRLFPEFCCENRDIISSAVICPCLLAFTHSAMTTCKAMPLSLRFSTSNHLAVHCFKPAYRPDSPWELVNIESLSESHAPSSKIDSMISFES
jgi:hypothetical protein